MIGRSSLVVRRSALAVAFSQSAVTFGDRRSGGHGFSRAASIPKKLGVSPSFRTFSIALQLLRIPFKISTSLRHRISAKLLQRTPCKRKRDHSFASHTGCRHNTHIGTLIRGLHRLASREVH